MFGTAAAIRILAFAGHWRPEGTAHDVVRTVQIQESDQEPVTRPKRSPRDVPWLAPEWWESHHYERR